MEFSIGYAVVAAVIFAVIIIIFSLIYKTVDLNDLESLPSEDNLFEERGVKVEQGGIVKSNVLMNCLIRVTTMRLIIAQKKAFADSWFVKHVINFDPAIKSIEKEKKDYQSVSLEKSKIRFEDEPGKKNRTVVVIEIPYSKGVRGQYLRFITNEREKFEKYF